MTNAQIAAFVASYIAADDAAREEMDIQAQEIIGDDTIEMIEVSDDCLVCYGESNVWVLGADGTISIE